jgi:hypothetical protein
MTAVRSSNGYLGFVKQASKGSAAAPTKFCRLSAAEGIEIVQDLYEARTLNGDEELDAIYKLVHKPNGSFQSLIRPDLGAAIMAFVLGADTVTTGTVHTHAIVRADTVPWLTIERKLDNIERISDCKINQVVINGQAGQPLSIDVSFMGLDSLTTTTATASYETDEPFMFFDGTFTIDSVANTNIKAFTITINRNLEEIQTTTFKRNDLVEMAFSVDLSYSLVFQASDAQYAAILYGGGTTSVDTLDDGDFTALFAYGAGSSARQFKITLPALKNISAVKHLDPATKAVSLDISAKAIKSGAAIITAECKNSVATAYI